MPGLAALGALVELDLCCSCLEGECLDEVAILASLQEYRRCTYYGTWDYDGDDHSFSLMYVYVEGTRSVNISIFFFFDIRFFSSGSTFLVGRRKVKLSTMT